MQHLRVGRDHDDGLLWSTGFDGFGKFVALHCRHGEIRDDKVKLAFLEHRQGVFAVAGSLDHVPVEIEHHLDGIADERLVIHYQNTSLRERRRSFWHNNQQLYSIFEELPAFVVNCSTQRKVEAIRRMVVQFWLVKVTKGWQDRTVTTSANCLRPSVI